MNANPEIASTIDAGGIKTNYHDRGSGAPVLLIHGSGPGVSAWANWRPVLPALSESFRVIAPDIVGFGYTERPEGIAYSIDTWVDHLIALMDALELPRVSIIGNSFGGALAMHVAIRAPKRVDRLVLMGSVGIDFPISDGLDAVWGYEPSVENMRKLLDIFAYDPALATDELARLRYDASTRPGVHEAYAAMFPAPRQAGVEALALSEDTVRSISQDTLLVHGRDDQVIPVTNSIRLNSLIDRSQLHVFGQCGHWVQIEHSHRFATLVSDFLSEPIPA
ncbi:2-hydroxymuconate-semialdehyde hydrolase [Streptomyces sp. BK022]|uniref:alpha/beta fold hydrolase n=1 Tax=Streptomyces sp. BK022 TaxID=2512123 RepID=UPI0010295002|nr:alpha/beta fold hydrolase [Streptomyces sp. BK022]RZU37832.1 2-hydroxymuconate-semialdehyde hydrolase [Streptomyces sp. BK022]